MMHRSRERCSLYTRVYLSTQTHVCTMSCVSLSTRKALHLGTKNYWLPFCSRVTNGICPSIELPSTQVCVLLCLTFSLSLSLSLSLCAVYQLHTIRNISPLSSPLCLRRFFSRKTRFYRCSYASELFTRHGALRGNGAVDEKSPGSGFQRARSGEIRLRFHGDTIHLLTPPMCDMTYIASYTLLLETNLPSEDLRLYRQY